MKLLVTILSVAAVSIVVLAQGGQDIQRYSYHVWGTVLDDNSRAIANLSVCFVPAERPINGRIPCVKTAADGTFAITVKETPDKYNVCASTTDSPLKLVPDKDPTHRVTCSKPIEFAAEDDCRKIELKFGNDQQ